MAHDLVHIAARAFNTPLLLHPRKAEIIASVLASRMSGVLPLVDVPQLEAASRSATLDRLDGEPRGTVVADRYGDRVMQERYRFINGSALITVEGSLVNRGAWVGPSMSGLTSYEGLSAQLASALADRDVAQIVLSFDCPGGEATGAFEMAETVRRAAAEKPVVAFVNGMAASAAYAMASAATRIVTIPSGISGSIGVVMLHLDRSQQMAAAGIKPTLIFAGDHKVDGNPFEALPAAVAAEFKAECDALRTMFVDTVARGRAGLTPEQVLATQARCFTGADAVTAGLADAVGTLDDILASCQPARPGAAARTGATMHMISETDHTAALASLRQTLGTESASALAAAVSEAAAKGAQAERSRIAGILGHAEAEGRGALARHLAFETDSTVEAAGGLLRAAAKEAAPAPAAGPKTHRLDAIVPVPQVKADLEVTEPSTDREKGAAAFARLKSLRG